MPEGSECVMPEWFHVFNYRDRMAVATAGGRTVYNDERSCFNCRRCDTCWNQPAFPSRPQQFLFRSGWDNERWSIYLKSVYGGICAQFWHSNDGIHSRMTATQAINDAKRIIKERPDWELE
jgi:hypothetical protein